MTDEVFVRFGGDASGLVDASNKASDAVERSTTRMASSYTGLDGAAERAQAAVRRAMDGFGDIINKYDAAGAKVRGLESDLQRMYAALRSGGLDAEQTRAANGAIERISGELAKAKAESEAFKLAGEGAMQAVGEGANLMANMTVRARTEMIVMAHEALQGRFSRMPGSFMVLAEQMGNVGHSMLAMAGYAAVAVGSIALLAKAFNDGAAEENAMNRAMEMTSNYAGMTDSSMRELASSISETTDATIGQAKALVTDLVQSGQIASGAVATVAQVAAEWADKTGQDVDKLTPKLIAMFHDPAKAAENLNSTMHFLTVAQMDQIRTLEELGDKEQAQVELANLLKQHLDSVQHSVGLLSFMWDKLKKSASDAWDSMMGMGRAETTQEKLADINKQLAAWGGAGNAAAAAKGTSSEQDVNRLLAQRADLMRQLNTQQAQAKQQSANAAENERLQEDMDYARRHSHLSNIISLEHQLDRLKADAGKFHGQDEQVRQDAIKSIEQQIANEKKRGEGHKTKGHKTDVVGQWRDQLDQMLLDQKAFGSQSTALEVQYWQQRVNETKAGTREHQAAVRALYTALRAQQSEQDRAAKQSSKDKLDQATAEANAEIAAKQHQVDMAKENDNFLVQSGQMNKKQQLLDEIGFENTIFALREKLLNQELGLMDKETQAWRQQKLKIEQLEQQHQLKILQLQHQADLQRTNDYKGLNTQMATLWNQGTQSMMSSTLTWANAERAVGMKLAGWFMSDVVMKNVQSWLAGELMKRGASEATFALFGLQSDAAAIKTVATKSTEATSVVLANAAEGASGAAASVSAIPGVGWAMVPAVFAATMGMIKGATSSIPSAAGGFDIPSGLNPITQLHEREMVLPAKYADAIRGMAAGGSSGGGDIHMHVHTQSTQDFAQFIARNSHTLGPAVRRMGRNFTPTNT